MRRENKIFTTSLLAALFIDLIIVNAMNYTEYLTEGHKLYATIAVVAAGIVTGKMTSFFMEQHA